MCQLKAVPVRETERGRERVRLAWSQWPGIGRDENQMRNRSSELLPYYVHIYTSYFYKLLLVCYVFIIAGCQLVDDSVSVKCGPASCGVGGRCGVWSKPVQSGHHQQH